MFEPFTKGWRPIEQDAIVSVRSVPIFGDEEIRRGKVCGWHIATGQNPDRRDPFKESKPIMEYQVKFLRSQTKYWVPADNIVGFLRVV